MLISARCENACGKFPSCRLAAGSYSSASSPTSLRNANKSFKQTARLLVTALQYVVVGQPEAAGQKGAFAGRQPIGAGLRVDSAARARLVSSSRSIAASVPMTRASSGGRKPTMRDQQQARIQRRRAIGLDERVRRGIEALARRPRRGSRRECAAIARAAPARPNSSAERTARSNATHAMTLEWVKCLRPPRTSQMPSSGWSQIFSRCVTNAHSSAQLAASSASPASPRRRAARRSPRHRRPAASVRRRRCRCAPARRPHSLAATGTSYSVSRRSPATPYMICSSSGLPATARSSQSRHAVASSMKARPDQRVQGERRIAQPAIAVIPVARAAAASPAARSCRRR